MVAIIVGYPSETDAVKSKVDAVFSRIDPEELDEDQLFGVFV